uniref:Uncharacterized protein n=1 Tax=Anguilla anguilla TaxID=7936 RepID=A0A0E9UYG6_ANGAN
MRYGSQVYCVDGHALLSELF